MHHGGHALGSVIRSGIATLPQILAKQGYRVIIAGKAHFGPLKDFPFEYLADSVMVLEGKTDQFRTEIFTAHSGDAGQAPKSNVAPMRAIRADRYKLIVNFHPEIAFQDAISVNTNFVENAYWLTWQKLARSGDAKAAALIAKFEHRPPVELYDLKADPFEMRNLAADPAQQKNLAALRQRLYAWMRSQGEDPEHVAMPGEAPRGKIPYTAQGDAGHEE